MSPEVNIPNLNYVLIAGNIIKDPAFRRTMNGTPVANFTIASSKRFRDNTGQWREDSCYIGVVAWYNLAEKCSEILNRGDTVIIDGELQSRSWKMDNGHYRNIVEIKARRVQQLQSKDTYVELNNEDDVTVREDEALEESDNRTDDSQNENRNSSEKEDNKSEPSDPESSDESDTIDFGYNQLKL